MLLHTLPVDRETLRILDDEEACIALLARYRWPRGFICPHCGSRAHRRIFGRPAWRCLSCRRHTRLTANTPLHGTHLPLWNWVYVIFMVGGRKQSISALQLQKDLGIAYSSALSMLRRVRLVLDERPDFKVGRGSVDYGARVLGNRDARDWPEAPDEQRKRTQALVIAVERIPLGHGKSKPGFLRAAAVPEGLEPRHFISVVTHADAQVQVLPTPRTSTIMMNLADWLRGTFHGVSRKHLSGYVREFTFRFNRVRFEQHLPGLVGRRLMKGSRAPRASLTCTAPSLDLTAEQLPPLELTPESTTGSATVAPTIVLAKVDEEMAAFEALLAAKAKEPFKVHKLADFRAKPRE